MQRKIILFLGMLLCASFAVEGFTQGGRMKLTSPAFKNGAYLPQRFSCDGDGVNPALDITGVPAQAQSLALIVDDPDAPIGTYVHWVVFDIPVVAAIEENSVPGKQGVNTGGRKDYASPCPPSGTHRYFFKVYALDTLLNLKEGISKGALENAMQGHILDQAQIIGLCKR